MKKTYQIKINQGKESKTFEVVPGSTKGQALTIKAVEGARYQLVDKETTYGPENIRTSRIGKDLNISFEGSNQTDVVIEDYYKATPEGFNGLIGEAETGKFYEYIPENASGLASVPMLSHSSQVVGMALGGAEVASSGAAVGVLAAGLFSPWLLGAGALGVAAAAGGGGGGSSGATGTTTTTSTPVVKSAELLTTDDTGPKDLVTNDKTPRISGVTTANADVSVEVNGKTYTKKADANGAFEIQIPDTDALPDAIYTPKVTASLNGVKSAVFDGTPFTVDTSEANNVPTKPDPNAFNNKIDITAITDDSGVGAENDVTRSDFYTNDKKLVFKGTLDKFTDNGDWIKLELKDVDAKVVDTAYVKPTASGAAWAWSWDRTNSKELVDGKYTLNATVVDGSDNVVGGAAGKVSDTQVIWIDTGREYNFNAAGTKVEDSNASLILQAITLQDDTGPGLGRNTNDYLTADQLLSFKGGFDKDFILNDDRIFIRIFGSDGKVISQQYVQPAVKIWDFNNLTDLGIVNDVKNYTIKAVLVDKAGNTLQATDQSFVIDRKVQINDASDVEKTSTNSNTDTWTYKDVKFYSTERGFYKYTVGNGVLSAENEYLGDFFDLTDLNNKIFESGTFRLEFKDLAGNYYTITNTNERLDFSNATLTHGSTTTLPLPGFGDGQLVGSIGKVELKDTDSKEFDMASLYDGIPLLGDVAAVNHVDLTKGDHVLKLTMGDVLELGVKNSFSTASAHKGDLQMRIDGDVRDQIVLDNLVGTIDYVWNVNNSPVTLDGKVYNTYTNDAFGLSLFVDQTVQINLV